MLLERLEIKSLFKRTSFWFSTLGFDIKFWRQNLKSKPNVEIFFDVLHFPW